MLKRRLISMALSVAMILGSLAGMTAVSAAPASDVTAEAAEGEVAVDFTTMSSVPVYSAAAKQGFVSVSGAIMPETYDRKVASTDNITVGANGASVTESNGDYLANGEYLNSSNYKNYGGLIYRVDTAPGAYHIEVTLGGSSTSSNTKIAPTGLNADNLTGTANWDNANHVPRTVSAKWEENTWSYDFATGESFVEVDIEPASMPKADAPQTVTVKSIKITPIAVGASDGKPTIHILGDSTQKAYTFNETISSWGQTLCNYFDLNKVNVINYSMGGRCMRNNYCEGRFDEILVRGKAGDFVFIHSAHNDESPAETRFDRGTNYTGGTAAQNNALYNRWLDMYVEAVKARGMTPVLVSPMTRGAGKAHTFNPDSPGNMRKKAASDAEVGYIELYQGSIDYYKKLDANEGTWTYNSVEAGETPANNSANGASGDGTHYREAAAKQFCRIMLQSIYDQANASTDTYTDKAIMQKLVSYMPQTVQTAANTGDWSAVFPEMAKDVSAVDVIPGATKQAQDNYYYRTSIEKALQLGLLHKDSNNLFKPTQTITVGEFARGVEKAWGLAENSLTNYTKTYAQFSADDAAVQTADLADEEASVAKNEIAEAADLDVSAAEDGYVVTVKQPENGEITIYNESALKSYTTDIPSGVKANQVVSDNEYFKLTAPSEIKAGSDKSGVFSDNKAISTNYVEFRNANPEKIVIYEAKADGIIKVYANAASNKAIEFVGTETQSGNVSGAGVVEFKVKAGETYKLWTRGGTGKLFGVKYESTDYPQSTESLTVNAKDNVKIVAAPDKGYLNKSITVNGKSVSTGGSYILTVTENSTVTADFKREPDYVDKTIIATDAALTRQAMGAIFYDAYQEFLKSGNEDAKKNMQTYMSQNGSVPSPDDPNYDPNLTYDGTPYIPLTGWGALTDIDELNIDLYAKVKAAYNLGLIRSEQGIMRGSTACGDELEPTVEVTRAKAAKALVFAFILTQLPSEESQVIPGGVNHAAETAEIAAPNPNAPKTPYVNAGYTYEITKAEYDAGGSLEVELSYLGEEASPKAKLIVASYSENDEKVLLDTVAYDVEGTTIKDFVYNKPENSIVKLYVWDGLDTMVPLSAAKTATLSANPVQSADPNPSQSPSYEKKATVVTASGDTFDFTSIRDAVAKAKEINPQSEAQRVTINVNPGDYEEQVMIENINYLTLQQTPDTADGGRVNLHWYYCTGYCAGDCGLDGRYDPKVNWSDPRTWNGYKEGDEKFTKYELGQVLLGSKIDKCPSDINRNITKISYYDTDGVAHKDVEVKTTHLGDFADQAPLFINNASTNITVKDFNIVNSIPVMVTEGEKAVGVAPQEERNADYATSYVLPRRTNLAVCSEDTPMDGTKRVKDALAIEDDVQKVKALEALTNLTAGESAYLALSDKYNERGHAISANGDKVIFENVRARGNQDSVYISSGRVYFKNCDLIGGTDYIYGDATAVFDSCKLGAEGMSNKDYGATITAANHDAANPYGYLFYNCELYNVLDNITNSQFGRPWRQASQITFYKMLIDDTKTTGASKAGISPAGWSDMSGNEKDLARFYEYGTYTRSGANVDTSKRVVNKSVEEGGTGIGTVLNEWQILEFNPRNYFNSAYQLTTKKRTNWDPMNFGETYLKNVDAAIASAAVTVPEGEATEVALPAAPDGIEFKWESASSNAVVTSDGKLQVIRPAAGEDAINTTVALYARDSKTGYGDKKDVNVTINPTTDTTNVFNIPVTVTQSASIGEDNTYTVTITKNGALIKEQQITLAAGQTTAEATIENIPASTSGIDYNVKVVSASGDFTIVEPTDGIKTIKGITGSDVNLTVTANKIVDASVALDISTAASNGNKTYDLIALAKAKDSENASNIENSEVIKVSFDVTVEAKPSKIGYVDFSAGTPEGTNSAKADRYAEIKINPSWVQLDSVDCSQGFSGSSNGDGQYLNITGKFAYPSTHNVTVIIDYKAGTVSVSGNGGTPYTFKNFPKDGARGKLNMGVFPESTSDKYTVSSVRLTYKKLVTGEEQPEVVPEGEGIFEFPGKAPNISGGNSCTDADTYAFVNGADEKAVSLFKDATDATKVKASLTANYLNYVVGTADNGSHPSIKIEKAGKYRVFYLGYNSDDSTKTAKINGKTFTFGAGVDFAESANKILKLYTADIEVPPSAEGSYLSFDCSSPYLPDLYSIIVAGTTDLGLTAAE